MAEKRRADRLSRQLKSELASIIDTRIDDPRVGNVALTRVRLSNDLGHATVYVHTTQDSERRNELLKGLNSARGFLRSQLSLRLPHLKRTPELRFEFDRSVEAGLRVEELLEGLESPEEPGGI
jgi:ribosome-binding factor A